MMLYIFPEVLKLSENHSLMFALKLLIIEFNEIFSKKLILDVPIVHFRIIMIKVISLFIIYLVKFTIKFSYFLLFDGNPF